MSELQSSSDPEALLASFTTADLANVKAYLVPSDQSTLSKVASPKVQTAYQNGCWNAAVAYVARNVFGVELYRRTPKGNWCTSGGLITSDVPCVRINASGDSSYRYDGVCGP